MCENRGDVPRDRFHIFRMPGTLDDKTDESLKQSKVEPRFLDFELAGPSQSACQGRGAFVKLSLH